jgi:molybdate-binding protein
LSASDLTIVNRPLGTGTRLLLDFELKRAGVSGAKLKGYDQEVGRHLDVGLEILAGRADAGVAIRTVADLLNLDFLPLRWERYDLMINKDRFFEEGIQRFLGLLHENEFRKIAASLSGYSLDLCGKMIFPKSAVTSDDEEP